MRHAKAFLLQLAAAAAIVPAEELNLQLLSDPDIDAVVEEAELPSAQALQLETLTVPEDLYGPVSVDLDTISTSESLRWGPEGERDPIGVQVKVKIDLN